MVILHGFLYVYQRVFHGFRFMIAAIADFWELDWCAFHSDNFWFVVDQLYGPLGPHLCTGLGVIKYGWHWYPLVNIQKAIENGHRNGGYSHSKWYFSIAMLTAVFQQLLCKCVCITIVTGVSNTLRQWNIAGWEVPEPNVQFMMASPANHVRLPEGIQPNTWWLIPLSKWVITPITSSTAQGGGGSFRIGNL